MRKAGEDADNQIQERRNAAQSELDGLAKRIAELQSREATITQRVAELRAMFAQAFSGFGLSADNSGDAAASLPVVNPVPEQQQESDDEQAQPDDAETDGQSAEQGDEAGQSEPSEPEAE